MVFGERIRLLREKRGLTIAECAQAVGVSASTYRDWEYGRAITGEPYIKMAQVLRVSLSVLLGGEDGDVIRELLEIESSLVEALNRVRALKAAL